MKNNKIKKINDTKPVEQCGDSCCCSANTKIQETEAMEDTCSCGCETGEQCSGGGAQAQQASPNQAVFQVTGITCMDCAQKFEKDIAALPGVTRAVLTTFYHQTQQKNANYHQAKYRIFPIYQNRCRTGRFPGLVDPVAGHSGRYGSFHHCYVKQPTPYKAKQ